MTKPKKKKKVLIKEASAAQQSLSVLRYIIIQPLGLVNTSFWFQSLLTIPINKHNSQYLCSPSQKIAEKQDCLN